jgi:hypothetical protein
MNTLTASDVRWTGWLLVGGAAAFMVGAILWRMAYQEPETQSLPEIAGDHARWMWIHAWMVLGVVITTVAFAGLRELLHDSGERMFSTFAFALYSFRRVTAGHRPGTPLARLGRDRHGRSLVGRLRRLAGRPLRAPILGARGHLRDRCGPVAPLTSPRIVATTFNSTSRSSS